MSIETPNRRKIKIIDYNSVQLIYSNKFKTNKSLLSTSEPGKSLAQDVSKQAQVSVLGHTNNHFDVFCFVFFYYYFVVIRLFQIPFY